MGEDCRHTRDRAGFTLVELLVVIAIIGILIALLLPAVQAAREAARRSQCSNNLKQLALGLHNYHDVYRSFPSGAIQDGKQIRDGLCNEGTHGCWAWTAFLLPFVEQQTLHDTLGVGITPAHMAAADATKLAVMQRPIPTLRCPSDTAPDLNSDQQVPNGSGSDVNCATGCVPIATANYVGSNHSWDLNRYTWNGLMGTRTTDAVQPTTMAQILDGTSNSFALGERAWLLGDRKLQAAVALMTNGDSDVSSDQGSVYAMGCGRYRLNCTDRAECARGFSSRHPGGSQFAMIDGSVRFVSETIDHNTSTDAVDSTFERLISIKDGQPVGEY